MYDVFISYSRADYLDDNNVIISDSPIVPILNTLESNCMTYWIDIDGNNATNQYMTKIAKAISCSNYVIFISSERSNGIDSYWPIKEILFACENRKKILPIKIDNSEFHDDLVLPLAGLDILEYYKNPQQSLVKLVKVVSNSGETDFLKKISVKQKIYHFFGILRTGLVYIFLFFCVSFTIGVGVGYFSNLEDAEQTIKAAYRNNKIESLNPHLLKYEVKDFCFTYDALTDRIVYFEENESKLEVSFESIMMSVSIPAACETIFKTSRYSGNGKTKIYTLILGTIGFFSGYTFGEHWGEMLAVIANKNDIKKYVEKKSTKEQFKKSLNHQYQVENEE